MVANSDVLKILRIDIYLKGADAQAIEMSIVFKYTSLYIVIYLHDKYILCTQN